MRKKTGAGLPPPSTRSAITKAVMARGLAKVPRNQEERTLIAAVAKLTAGLKPTVPQRRALAAEWRREYGKEAGAGMSFYPSGTIPESLLVDEWHEYEQSVADKRADKRMLNALHSKGKKKDMFLDLAEVLADRPGSFIWYQPKDRPYWHRWTNEGFIRFFTLPFYSQRARQGVRKGGRFVVGPPATHGMGPHRGTPLRLR